MVCHRKPMFPKFLRHYFLSRRKPLRFRIKRRTVWIVSTANEESLLNADIDEQALHNSERAQFVAPSLDKSRLIIEELKMGHENYRHHKAFAGSKVSVYFEYKSEDGERLVKGKCHLVLGSSKAMRELHDGICGMSAGDKRRFHIPSSLRSGRRAICEVELIRVHY